MTPGRPVILVRYRVAPTGAARHCLATSHRLPQNLVRDDILVAQMQLVPAGIPRQVNPSGSVPAGS